ncbi:hypothetical protein LCGC14_1629280, partial [marine sediment metagenome]
GSGGGFSDPFGGSWGDSGDGGGGGGGWGGYGPSKIMGGLYGAEHLRGGLGTYSQEIPEGWTRETGGRDNWVIIKDAQGNIKFEGDPAGFDPSKL